MEFKNEEEFEAWFRKELLKDPNCYILPKIAHPNVVLPDVLFTINGQLFAMELKTKLRGIKREAMQFRACEELLSKNIIASMIIPEDAEELIRIINEKTSSTGDMLKWATKNLQKKTLKIFQEKR